MKNNKWHGRFDLTCRDKSGAKKWQETIFNCLADEGEYLILDVFLRGGTAPDAFFIRLFNDTPIETDALSDLDNEPAGNGYSAAELSPDSTGWPTLALDSGDYMATSAEVEFEADGGSIGPVTYVVLATSSLNLGNLVAFAPLSEARTLADGETLAVSYSVKLS